MFHGHTRRDAIRSGLSLLAAPLLCGQQDATFSTDVKVVNLLATVRDGKGQIIRDLTKDDFSLLESGRPQAIRYFAQQSDLPLTLGLMVDTSVSQQRVLNAERGASLRFFDQVLREAKDHAFIMQFDMSIQVRQGLTASRRDLDEILPFVDTPTNAQLRNQGSDPGTLLYDAVLQASNDIMKTQTGRKALIVLSDGVDTGSQATVIEAVAAAQRTDTLIYSILFADSGAYGGFSLGAGGRNALTRMARETGGSFFEVSKKQSLEHIFDTMQDELRSQYSLGYVSDRQPTVSEFRKIQLTTGRKGLTVQTRDKYWAKA